MEDGCSLRRWPVSIPMFYRDMWFFSCRLIKAQWHGGDVTQDPGCRAKTFLCLIAQNRRHLAIIKGRFPQEGRVVAHSDF